MKGDHLGEFEELVLLAIRRLGEEATSSGIQHVLESKADRRATLGAIYAALDRADRKGLVASWLGESMPVRGGRARRKYELTRAGEVALRASRRVRETLWRASRQAS